VRWRVGADSQRENGEEARRSRTRARRTPPRNPSWCLTGARGKGKEERRRRRSPLYAMDFTTEKGGRNFPFSRASPPRPLAAGANRLPSAARSRALWLRWKMAYERSQAEGAALPLAGQAEGGEKGAKHENGLSRAQSSPRATPSNTPLLPPADRRRRCSPSPWCRPSPP
jgi:hypothetical protein